MKTKIKILQLIAGLQFGGAETKLLELISKMDSRQFETIVCSLGMGDHIRKEFEALGINLVCLERKSKVDFGLVFKVAELIRRERIDVVMTTLFYADVVGALAGKIGGAKAIFFWETISAPEWLVMQRLLAYRFAMRFCDRIISVSQTTARWLIEKRGVPENKIIVIPYGVDVDLYRPDDNSDLKSELGIQADVSVVGVVARLHPQKGHRYLIEAADQIIAEKPDVRFVFVGDGELRAELEALVRDKGINNHFLFLGFRRDVHEVLRIFDVFVLPSLYEGLPNVVLEAMATGKPVVASSVDGTTELVVDSETGFLVPPRNSQVLADKISLLLSDRTRAQKLGEQGRKHVEKYFSLQKEVENFHHLFHSFLMEKQRVG